MARRARAVCWHGFVQHSGATGAPVKATGRQHDAEPRRYPTFAAFAEQHHTFDSARTRHEVFDRRLHHDLAAALVQRQHHPANEGIAHDEARATRT